MNQELASLLAKKRAIRNQKLKERGIVYEDKEQTLEEAVQEYQKTRTLIKESGRDDS
jgi:hypothetical protein